MKYMAPLCAVLAPTAMFLTSFVNREVLCSALSDTSLVYVRTGNTVVLTGGCFAFALLSVLFLTRPGLDGWGVWGLVVVYAMQDGGEGNV